MGPFDILALLLSLSALFSYFNYRVLHLPGAIGVMLIALLLSLALLLVDALGYSLADRAQALLAEVHFDRTMLHGMLSFLLFAGALEVDLEALQEQKWTIAVLALCGVLVSMVIIGGLAWWAFGLLGLRVDLLECLLFGALISPTDPIAVLGIVKRAGIPHSLETKIAGESLFNDGIGVVVFLVLLGIVQGHEAPSVAGVGGLFLREAVGGALFGLAVGWIAYRMLKSVDNYPVEVLVTLGLVSGGYALADALHLSGPIAIVVAGLLIGNHGRLLAMSETTRRNLDTFWELIDVVLNAVLFVLIGMELLVVSLRIDYLAAGLVAIPIVLLARFASVGAPVLAMRLFRRFSPKAVRLLTWGGLRGGISVALALSLPPGGARDLLITVTYVVVVFSILVQGLTVGRLVRRVA